MGELKGLALVGPCPLELLAKQERVETVQAAVVAPGPVSDPAMKLVQAAPAGE